MSGGAVLVFSKTAGYRHPSIPAGISALREILDDVDVTEDAAAFGDENLARYRLVVFLNTSGDVFDAGQRAAFERFIRAGGGYVGVHSASTTEYEWPFYGDL